MQCCNVKAHAADVPSSKLEPHGQVSSVTIELVLLSVRSEKLSLGDEVVMSIILLFLVLEVRWVLPPMR